MSRIRSAALVALVLILAGVGAVRCQTEPRVAVVRAAAAPPGFPAHLVGWGQPATTTTSTSTTTTQPPAPPTTRSAAHPAPVASPVDDAFWRRLANCESPNGANGGFNGYFQLAGSTAKAVGYHGGTYEEQLVAAKAWLAKIGIAKAGTRAGWPICWWVALRGGH